MTLNFTLEEPALRVTDNEVEIKFLHQVVKTFNWPLGSNIDIVHKRRVYCGSKELKGTGHFNVPKRKFLQINDQTNCRLQ